MTRTPWGLPGLYRSHYDSFQASVAYGAADRISGDSSDGTYAFPIRLDSLPLAPRIYTELTLDDGLGFRSIYSDWRTSSISYPAGDGQILIVDSFDDAYDTWLVTHSGIPASRTSPMADADDDGFPNGNEFYLGMNPMFDSNSSDRVPEIVAVDGQFGLRVPVDSENLALAPSGVDATPKAQWSDDAETWHDIPAPELVDGTPTFLVPFGTVATTLVRFVVTFGPGT